MGNLGAEQLAWLAGRPQGQERLDADRPCSRISRLDDRARMGWGTQDSAQALALLASFGSVTVLNGHILN